MSIRFHSGRQLSNLWLVWSFEACFSFVRAALEYILHWEQLSYYYGIVLMGFLLNAFSNQWGLSSLACEKLSDLQPSANLNYSAYRSSWSLTDLVEFHTMYGHLSVQQSIRFLWKFLELFFGIVLSLNHWLFLSDFPSSPWNSIPELVATSASLNSNWSSQLFNSARLLLGILLSALWFAVYL